MNLRSHVKSQAQTTNKPHMKNKLLLVLLTSGLCAYSARTLAQQTVIEKVIDVGLQNPFGVAADNTNVYYITDSANHRIVKYNPDTGKTITFAGTPGVAGNNDDNRTNGVFATFFNPQGIALTQRGFIVADSGNQAIRRINLTNGVVDTIAGDKNADGDFADGNGTAARFNSPYGVTANKDGTVIYIADLGNNAIRKLDLANLNFPVTTVVPSTVASNKLFRPYAVAVDNNDQLYIADLGNHCIKLFNPADNSLTIIAGSPDESGDLVHVWGPSARFASPSGILWVGGDTGLLMCDMENHNLRRLYFNTNYNRYSVETFPADATQAAQVQSTLNSPIGMTKDTTESIVIVDNGGNAVYRMPSSQSTQPPVSDPIIGIIKSTPYTNTLGTILYDTILTAVINATLINEAVVGIACNDQDGVRLFYTLNGSDPNQNNGFETTPFVTGDPIPNPGLIDTSHPTNVVVKAIATAAGRKPSKVVAASFSYRVSTPNINGDDASSFTVSCLTTGARLYYTTDGSDPTTNTPTMIQLNSEGVSDALSILNGTNDVPFKILATKDGYVSSSVSKLFLFQNIRNNSIGVPRDYYAGVGSTIVVPVVVKIGTGKPMRSMQFRVEVSPDGSQDPIPSQFRALTVDPANDFIPVVTPSASGVALFNYSPYSYANTNGNLVRGLAISFVGSNANFMINDYATVTMLALPIPGTAAPGNRYTITIKEPSGTTDAAQTPAKIVALTDRAIIVSNISYTVGDSAIANWYNAGDFGNTNLANNDVNNAFYSSMGVKVPYSFSDVFDAMDAFPVDTDSSVGGDGQIRYLDWQVVLIRSLRLDTNNWTRNWSSSGHRVSHRLGALSNVPLLPGERLKAVDNTSGFITLATVGALPVSNAKPGQAVLVPLYLKVNTGANVAGLQFRAVVTPENGAPEIAGAQFLAGANLPAPWSLLGLPANQVSAAWPIVSASGLGSLNLQGSNIIGYLQFQVPVTAESGQFYTVHFANADGAQSLSQSCDFDAIPATVGVQTPAPVLNGPTDGWKNFFFGSYANPLADANANPTGDGFNNFVKWLSGFNPEEYLAKYGITLDKFATRQFTLRWVTKSGETYIVEKSTDLVHWTQVENVSGNDLIKTFFDSNAGQPSVFYRVRKVNAAGN
jgi:hypothetical protein